MHRHELDPVSLFFGMALVLVAGGYTLTHTTDVRLHWLLALPALLVLIGAAVIVTVLRKMSQPMPAGSTPTTDEGQTRD